MPPPHLPLFAVCCHFANIDSLSQFPLPSFPSFSFRFMAVISISEWNDPLFTFFSKCAIPRLVFSPVQETKFEFFNPVKNRVFLPCCSSLTLRPTRPNPASQNLPPHPHEKGKLPPPPTNDHHHDLLSLSFVRSTTHTHSTKQQTPFFIQATIQSTTGLKQQRITSFQISIVSSLSFF